MRAHLVFRREERVERREVSEGIGGRAEMGTEKGARIEETTWWTVLEARKEGVMEIMSPIRREEAGSWTRRDSVWLKCFLI